MKHTTQIKAWAGEMGNAYVDHNPHSIVEMEKLYQKDYGVNRMSMNKEFLTGLPKDMSILEVGANVGVQLAFLREAGFANVLGVDVNRHAVKEAKRFNPDVDVIHGSGFDLPFSDKRFDLVYTSGVLIHIAPDDIGAFVREMERVSKRYIWSFEYYAPQYVSLRYRDSDDLLWKTDFAALFLEHCPHLRLVKEKKFKMLGSENVSQMFLLEKS